MDPGHAEQNYDVIIAGGGPAGSLLASLVRAQDPDRSVLVLERERFPRHHVGESTLANWEPILRRAGVLAKIEAAGFIRKAGGLFHWGDAADESWTADFRDGSARPRPSWQVDRARFDHLLLDHARSLGATVVEEATVRAVTPRDGGGHRVAWEHGGVERSAGCAFVADASGQARLLSRLWQIPLVPFDGMNNFAVYGYWRGAAVAEHGPPLSPRERWTYIGTSDAGWVWSIPIEEDLVSVGLVTEADALPRGGDAALEAFYVAQVTGAPRIGELLRGASLGAHPLAPSRLMVVRDWSYAAARVAGPGWFLVGDAATFVDPMLSSGLLLAVTGASMAANALHTIWTEPDVDAELLRASYGAAYADMARSYHRLASIWYARNFKVSSWHWEAKRQRLRRGDGDAQGRPLLALAMGAFTNPVAGAGRGDAHRADARIIADRLFSPRADRLQGAPEKQVQGAAHEDAMARLRAMLARRTALAGCTYALREGYFTDGAMDRWARVRYVELRPAGSADDIDRSVLPSIECAPLGVLPLLDGTRTLREALAEIGAPAGPGSDAYRDLSRAIVEQVLHLDLRGFLSCEKGDAAAAGEPPWPEPLRAAFPPELGAAYEIDALGLVLTVDLPGQGTIQLAPPSPGVPSYAQAAGIAIGYQTPRFDGALRAAIERLVAGLRAWERRSAAQAAGFWGEVVGPHAGQRGVLGR